MRTLITCGALICGAVAASPAFAQEHNSKHAQSDTKSVNAMCPIGKEPIVPSAGTVEYKGKTIGICCPGCGKQFLAWDEERKDEFVMLAIAHKEPGQEQHAGKSGPAEAWTGPYTLATCPVSGQALGSMGDPIIAVYDGREVRFCCDGCIDKFEANQAKYWKAIDEQIIKDQLPYYPVETCVVSGEPLTEHGEDIANNMVYGNRLVRLCCKMCEREFTADPNTFIEKLDKAAADAQRKDYPLDTCVVAGGKLGSMGEPTEIVVAGRLIRFCCASCEPKVEANPVKYITAIDAAWHSKDKFRPADEAASHEEHGGHDDGHGDHDGHDH